MFMFLMFIFESLIRQTVVSNGRCNDVRYFSRLFYCGSVDFEVNCSSRGWFSTDSLIMYQIVFIRVRLLSLKTYDIQQTHLFCLIVQRAFAQNMCKFVRFTYWAMH